MTISKRLRYEILRRDNHTCRYCGAFAPHAQLTIDHVIPIALGGQDELTNLVTSCTECNAGKSSNMAAEEAITAVAEDAMRWAQTTARTRTASIEPLQLLPTQWSSDDIAAIKRKAEEMLNGDNVDSDVWDGCTHNPDKTCGDPVCNIIAAATAIGFSVGFKMGVER